MQGAVPRVCFKHSLHAWFYTEIQERQGETRLRPLGMLAEVLEKPRLSVILGFCVVLQTQQQSCLCC